MMRLAKNEVEQVSSNTGEVDCILWREIKFSWDSNINNVDQYTAEGYFLGIHPKYVYEQLTISADFTNNIFYLKTGRGKPITWVNILNI
jgi:hypothetical protein